MSVWRLPMCQASRARSCGGCRGDLDQRLGLAGDPHDRAVVEHQPVAVAQRGRLRQIEQERVPPSPVSDDAAAMAVVGIEHDAVDRARLRPSVPAALHLRMRVASDRSRQNRKYRCAIGSTSAGAQVSSSPSARTS